MQKIIDIILLIAIIIATTCVLVVIIDYHKQIREIKKYFKEGNKNDKRRN
jgi:hypothetical protein